MAGWILWRPSHPHCKGRMIAYLDRAGSWGELSGEPEGLWDDDLIGEGQCLPVCQLSSVPRIHMVEGEATAAGCPPTCSVCACARLHAQTANRKTNNSKECGVSLAKWHIPSTSEFREVLSNSDSGLADPVIDNKGKYPKGFDSGSFHLNSDLQNPCVEAWPGRPQ